MALVSNASSSVAGGTGIEDFYSSMRGSPTHNEATIVSPTPHQPSVSYEESEQSDYEEDPVVRRIEAAVKAELVDAWVEEAASLPFKNHLAATVEQEYPDLDNRVRAWLYEYSGYDHDHGWAGISEGAEEDLIYAPIVRIMDDILEAFGQKTEEKDGAVIKRRKVQNTYNKESVNGADSDPRVKTQPDITLFGTGPSATKETDFIDPSYTQVASMWEVKTRPVFNGQARGQLGSYAREVFIQQPNRRFVYATLMTSMVIRIFRFDRAGCYYSRPIAYHKDPAFFVKLVLLLSSFNEELLGFDTSVSWVSGQRVMKMTPTELFNTATQSWEANTEELVFKLAAEPVFSRQTICSRGTVCWAAEYAGRQYIIKESWRTDGRPLESAFLKQLAGIQGVGQMFAFADDRDSIKAGRGFDQGETMLSDGQAKPVPNKWFMRLVLPKYGETLEKARSPRQLLSAVRDIVQGHRDALMCTGIPHRDISFHNVLLSPYDTAGVLIDWDLAKNVDELIASGGTDATLRTGTRAYQSVKVLLGSPRLGHHDNMDDLESVFYVLFHVLFGYDTSGNPLRYEALGNIAHWQNLLTEPTMLSHIKQHLLDKGAQGQLLTRCPPGPQRKILLALIKDLQNFFKPRMCSINAALEVDEDHVDFPAYDPGEVAGRYEAFLAIIDETIQKLPQAPTDPMPSPNQLGSNKRYRAGGESEWVDPMNEVVSKRRRTAMKQLDSNLCPM